MDIYQIFTKIITHWHWQSNCVHDFTSIFQTTDLNVRPCSAGRSVPRCEVLLGVSVKVEHVVVEVLELLLLIVCVPHNVTPFVRGSLSTLQTLH